MIQSNECYNTNVDKTGSDGHGCNAYEAVPADCGKFDDEDFTSNEMCCICGGGRFGNNENMSQISTTTTNCSKFKHDNFVIGKCWNTNGDKTDRDGDSCSAYTSAAGCGKYDDDDFKSRSMCCICGGGRYGIA